MKNISAGLLLSAMCASNAFAFIFVAAPNANTDIVKTFNPLTGLTDIVITYPCTGASPPCDSAMFGRALIDTSASDAIGTITIRNRSTTGQQLRVEISGLNGLSDAPSSIQGIYVGGGATDNRSAILITKLDLQGDIGTGSGVALQCNRLTGLNIQGDILGDVDLFPDDPAVAGAFSGRIGESFIGGSILGDIYVIDGGGSGNGEIVDVVIEGSIGTSSNLSLVVVESKIKNLQVGSLNAVVTNELFDAVPQIDDLVVTDDTGEDGVFRGLIFVDDLVQDAGDPSTLSFEGGIAAGSKILLKDALLNGSGEIIVPTGGLDGQIIIGADGSAGTWTGPVDVGATTLAPVYSNTASSLGGGSVGRVPFEPHRTDSSPVLGANITFTTSTVTPSYDIRHYGPVIFDDQASPLMPIRIEKRARCEGTTWLDVTVEWDFDYGVNSSNDTIVDMDATTAAHYRNGFEYRFVAETDTGEDDVLLCDLGLTSDPAVAVYPNDAWFTVGSECPWDTDGSGEIDVDDLNAVLGDWDETGNNLYGDINGDGVVDVDDLNLVLGHWEETSCSGCSMSMMGGGGSSSFMMLGATPGDLLVSELGYATVEDFCSALDGMDGESQDAMLIALGLVAAGE